MRFFQLRAGRHVSVFLLLGAFFPASFAGSTEQRSSYRDGQADQPLTVIKAYLRALQARDSRAAYRRISARDRAVRNEQSYIQSQETFDGFALELGRRFASEMKVWVIDHKTQAHKARFEVGYRFPSGDEIASELFDWNGQKLNLLSPAEQQRLIKTFKGLKGSGKMVMIEGRESLALVRETDGWRIFLDWPARTRVIFKTKETSSSTFGVRFLRNDLLISMNEPFQIDFIVTNRGAMPVAAQLNHVIEPGHLAPNVAMIACGLLSPFILQPRESREFSSSYIVSGLTRRSHLAIIYDFVTKTGAKERTAGSR